jgi:molecular chaperone DnaJ
MCAGRGEISQVQRSFLGQVMTTRPCPQCNGFGTVIPRPCPECAGDGRVRSRRTLTIKVPAGVDTGTRIQLTGQGEVGAGGGPAGDLYVEVRVRPHEIFTREGDDLHCTLTLPMTAAALGTTVPMETLDGRQVIDVRAGTQSGQVITLAGRGAGRLRSATRGDLLVHVEVATPTRLDDRQRELLTELAELRDEHRPADHPDGQGLFAKLRGAWSGR